MQAAHASMDAIDELQGGGAVRAQRGDLPNSVGVEQRPERILGQLVTTDEIWRGGKNVEKNGVSPDNEKN